MIGEKNVWLYMLVVAVLVLQFVTLFKVCTGDNNGDGQTLKRDSILQMKIDSLNANINDYFDHRIYENEQKLDSVNRIISVNKSAYKQHEKELFQNNTPDSIRNWIKRKLYERAGTTR